MMTALSIGLVTYSYHLFAMFIMGVLFGIAFTGWVMQNKK